MLVKYSIKQLKSVSPQSCSNLLLPDKVVFIYYILFVTVVNSYTAEHAQLKGFTKLVPLNYFSVTLQQLKKNQFFWPCFVCYVIYEIARIDKCQLCMNCFYVLGIPLERIVLYHLCVFFFQNCRLHLFEDHEAFIIT